MTESQASNLLILLSICAFALVVVCVWLGYIAGRVRNIDLNTRPEWMQDQEPSKRAIGREIGDAG